jgi:hypothetical protein
LHGVARSIGRLEREARSWRTHRLAQGDIGIGAQGDIGIGAQDDIDDALRAALALEKI